MYTRILGKTRYDFRINAEMPYINPMTYFNNIDLVTLSINLHEHQKLDLLNLTFTVIEYIVIVTQSNFLKENLVTF